MKNFLKIIAGTFVGSLLAMVLGTLILIGVINSVASLTDTATPAVPGSAILGIDFGNTITEQATDDPLESINPFSSVSSKTTGILDFIQTIDKAATDPSIKFIYMNLDKLNAGISHIEEIRAALVRFHESGKPIISYADNYSQAGYYLASVSDKIYLNPAGTATLTGLSISTLFFKDLMDKMGIETQLIRHGKFKAAAEQFISNKMSDENREQLQAYLDAVWNTWVADISAARQIPQERINEMTSKLELNSAQKALEAGLVDGLLYKDELSDTLVDLFGVEEEKDLKLISNTDYSKARKKTNFKEKNKIAVIYANGDIIMGKSDDNIASDSYVAMLSKIRKDSTIKAVVLRVNSPGGSAQSAEIIDKELALIREHKPVIVCMGDYAASGGYWISAKADKIITNNTTLTGSIGVFSMAVNVQKAMNKHLSINAETVTTNKHSDIMSGYRSLDNEEIAFIQSSVEIIYNQFLKLVAEGRGLSTEFVDSIAQGRIWSGYDAIKIGLADERGGLHEAINSAVAMSKLDSYRLVEYPVKKSQIDKIIEELSTTTESAKVLSNPDMLMEKAYSKLKEEKGVKTYARLPFNIYFN
ncbi:MAG: signal peptide peptidase SppA [Bacteroidales bacterium]